MGLIRKRSENEKALSSVATICLHLIGRRFSMGNLSYIRLFILCFRFTVGMGFSLMYGALLTKTNRISRIFHSASQSARRPSYISPRSQLIFTAVFALVQFGATLVWVIAAVPASERVFPQRDEVRINMSLIIIKEANSVWSLKISSINHNVDQLHSCNWPRNFSFLLQTSPHW